MSTKDLGDLGVAAGDIIDRAFTLGYETGRNYIPDGGMALTAEKKAEIWQLGYDYGAYDERMSRDVTGGKVVAAPGNPYVESTLFSALEPDEEAAAEERCAFYAQTKHGDIQCNLPDGHAAHHRIDPAPAGPAEEETKAEAESDLDMHPDAVYGREYVEQAKVRRIARAVKECDTLSSSPVVPAPTETGPKTWCAITGADSNPGGEHAYVTVRVPKDFVSGQSMADLAGAGKSRELARLLAPFVAAEEG